MSRRLLWGLLTALLLGVAAFGALAPLFGVEALRSGADPGRWIFRFAVLVVAPLSAVGFCAYKAFRPH